jgi:hypothetical protein
MQLITLSFGAAFLTGADCLLGTALEPNGLSCTNFTLIVGAENVKF